MPDQAPTCQPLANKPPAWWQERLRDQLGLRAGQAKGVVRALFAGLRDDVSWPETLAALPGHSREWVAGQITDATIADAGLTLVDDIPSDDASRRLLLRTLDGLLIESVIIPSARGRASGRTTLCVSSQVGCGRGCRFCETGRLGLSRQLSAAEICAQWSIATRLWSGARGASPALSHVVFMGMGEPMDNLDAVLDGIAVICDDLAFGLAARRVTVSSVGVGPAIRRFLRESKAHLAVSLNAPDDRRRSAIMPVNHRCSLAELRAVIIEALPPGRDVLIEYIVFAGINDSDADAQLLADWLKGVPARLNLIPANPGPDPLLHGPTPERLIAFRAQMQDRGVRTLVRHPHGGDIGGACGQLAGSRLGSPR